MDILEVIEGDDRTAAFEREKFYIAKYRADGHPLTNAYPKPARPKRQGPKRKHNWSNKHKGDIKQIAARALEAFDNNRAKDTTTHDRATTTRTENRRRFVVR
jgi:hypothetical protein